MFLTFIGLRHPPCAIYAVFQGSRHLVHAPNCEYRGLGRLPWLRGFFAAHGPQP